MHVLAALSFAFVALGIASTVTNRRRGRRELVVDADAFELPKSVWATHTVRVERAQVLRYAAQNTMGTKVVSVITAAGPVHVSNRLVGEDGYQAVLAWLESGHSPTPR